MAGAFALILAAFGSAVVGGTTDDNSLKADKYQTISQNYTGPDDASAVGTVDVSRDFDRTVLKKQARAQAAQREIALKNLAKKVDKQSDLVEKNQWVLPVTGYRLTATFGQRSGLWSSGMHTGLDFAGPSGSTIVSVAAGTVKSAGFDGSYGNRTIVTLEDGTEIWYCHQTSFLVGVGDVVRGGEAIGTVGSTGNSTGPHLHIEVRPGGGDPVDPVGAFLEHDLTF